MSFIDPGMSRMPNNPWRSRWQQAAFGGAVFFVERDAWIGGRRIALHEYPKRDLPYAEDMGRRATRHPIQGYLIVGILGADYIPSRNRLRSVLDREGAQTLVHPLLGQMNCVCEFYSVTEQRERGGFCLFDMSFVEAGSADSTAVSSANTQFGVANAANNTDAAAASNLSNAINAQDPSGTAPSV